MQILITVALAGVAALQTPSFSGRATRSDPVLVRSVVDGHTIDVAGFGRVRLLGIDAPRIRRAEGAFAPFGIEARDRLAQLLLHRWVRLEAEGALVAGRGRHVAYVLTEDGVFVNAALVRDGLARVAPGAAVSRLPELQRAEAEARAFRRGMWGSAAPAPAPSYTRPSTARRPPTSRTRTPASKRRKTRTKKP